MRLLLTAVVVTPLVVVVIKAALIGWQVEELVSARLEHVPTAEVGVVLGCSPRTPDGRANLFFSARMRAASDLFRAGKVKRLIVSGDNGSATYDEPTAMRDALVELGVPAANIERDFAGFRTLDSMVRAKEVFGVRRTVVVSQAFHAERAVFLARAYGVEAYGYAAADVGGTEGLKVRAREVLSRIAAVLDVYVLHTRPRFGQKA